MARFDFDRALRRSVEQHAKLVARKNHRKKSGNGIVERWEDPALTSAHVPVHWRYDLDRKRNPFFQERLDAGSLSDVGAIVWKGRIHLVAAISEAPGNGCFAIAESASGTDRFAFRDRPFSLAESDDSVTTVGGMRLTVHEDGWVYGLFRTLRTAGDDGGPETGSSIAGTGIARTKDLVQWERLPDLKSPPAWRRGAVLHPELVKGRYALHTWPLDGSRRGDTEALALAFCETMDRAEIESETILDRSSDVVGARCWTGAGGPPLKTPAGWLHIARTVRLTAAGCRGALRARLCDLEDPAKVIACPSGAFLLTGTDRPAGVAPDFVSGNGAVLKADGEVFIYYGSGARIRVATSTLDRLLDHVLRAPQLEADPRAGDQQRIALVERNLRFLARTKAKAYRDLVASDPGRE